MQAFLNLMSLSLFFVAILILITGSLNAIFGWSLGIKVGASSMPLPDEFGTVVILAIVIALIGGFFYIIGNLKQTGAFLKKYRWYVFSGLVVAIAAGVIGLANFLPNLSLELAVQGGNEQKHDYPADVLNNLTYWSLKNEDFELTKKMLAEGADLQHQRGEFRTTLLHEAVAYFPPTATDFLIEQNIDVNAQDDFQMTALHRLLSYREGNLEGTDEAEILAIAKSLVAAGADLTLKSEFDKTPIEIAKDKNYTTIVTFFESQ